MRPMEDKEKPDYIQLAKSGISPVDFYSRLMSDGVSKFDAFVLLRDGFGLSLPECTDVSKQAEAADI